jgi:hypothetical protein
VVIWITAILMISAIALFIAAPLSDHAFTSRSSAINPGAEPREHEYTLTVQALRELEFDHAMGKLDEGDYRILRERLEHRALALMGKKVSRPGQAEQLAPVITGSPPNPPTRNVTMNFCPQCGTRLGRAHNFCANCGAPLAMTSTAVK